jgi:predicted RND superfamily exporter protein
MNKVAQSAAEILWRWRILFAVACLIVTAIAASQLMSLSVSNSLEIWYPQDAAELVNYRKFQQKYGNDEIVVVAVSSPPDADFRGDAGIVLIGDITDLLLDIEGVATVTSMVTVPESLAEARGRLLSADGKTTALVVQMMSGDQFEVRRHQILLDINAAIETFGFDSRVAGFGVVYDGLNEASTTGSATLLLLAHSLMFVLLLLFFQRPVPVLVTLLAVGIAMLWTMGLYAALGRQLNMVTMALPTLVLVIGIADCVHLLRSVARQENSGSRQDRVTNGLGQVLGPCFVTSITTAAGFLALTTSSLPVVRDLGLFGAVGMLAAFVSSFVFCTLGLSWQSCEPKINQSRLDRLARKMAALAAEAPWKTVSAFTLLLILAGVGMSRLETDTNSIGYLQENHKIRRDSDFIESRIGPYVPLDFTVTATGSILSGEALDAVQAWQVKVTAMDEVGWSWSLLDALAVKRGERPSIIGETVISTRFERVRTFSPVTTAAMISADNELRISFGVPIMSARTMQALISRIESAAELPDNLSLRPAGYSPLYTRIVDEIVRSQVQGFSAAILMILALLAIAMRSTKRVLLAIPANIIPVVLTLGLMGFTGIPLDVATATIATVILGLVVDDTVHILRPANGRGLQASLMHAVDRSGGTLLLTSLTLAAGFLVLWFAQIRSIAWFGALTSFAMLVAIATDLLLLPALAKLFGGPARS